ncbi:hypothetical protein C8J56DRAFT_1056438 [Mycena floridula]|nr:hypothetical protein C8J56DRAFT_1056438 [Mycena floridula]
MSTQTHTVQRGARTASANGERRSGLYMIPGMPRNESSGDLVPTLILSREEVALPTPPRFSRPRERPLVPANLRESEFAEPRSPPGLHRANSARESDRAARRPESMGDESHQSPTHPFIGSFGDNNFRDPTTVGAGNMAVAEYNVQRDEVLGSQVSDPESSLGIFRAEQLEERRKGKLRQREYPSEVVLNQGGRNEPPIAQQFTEEFARKLKNEFSQNGGRNTPKKRERIAQMMIDTFSKLEEYGEESSRSPSPEETNDARMARWLNANPDSTAHDYYRMINVPQQSKLGSPSRRPRNSRENSPIKKENLKKENQAVPRDMAIEEHDASLIRMIGPTTGMRITLQRTRNNDIARGGETRIVDQGVRFGLDGEAHDNWSPRQLEERRQHWFNEYRAKEMERSRDQREIPTEFFNPVAPQAQQQNARNMIMTGQWHRNHQALPSNGGSGNGGPPSNGGGGGGGGDPPDDPSDGDDDGEEDHQDDNDVEEFNDDEDEWVEDTAPFRPVALYGDDELRSIGPPTNMEEPRIVAQGRQGFGIENQSRDIQYLSILRNKWGKWIHERLGKPLVTQTKGF